MINIYQLPSVREVVIIYCLVHLEAPEKQPETDSDSDMSGCVSEKSDSETSFQVRSLYFCVYLS